MFQVRAEPAFDFQSAEYCELFARSKATAFQHPLWLHQVYSRLAPPAGAKAAVIVVRAANDGQLVAVLPLIHHRQYGLRVVEFADFKVGDYASPVCDPSIGKACAQSPTLFPTIREALKSFDVLRLRKLRADPHCFRFLFGSAPVSPMSLCRHAVDLYEPVADWRRHNIDKTTLKELDQKGRQLRRKGEVRLEPVTNLERIRDSFAVMRQFRDPRFRDREGDDLVQDQVTYDFYLDIALQGKGGLSRTYALLVDERPVAVCFGLVHDRAFLMLLMGFDRDSYKNQSVGLLLIDEVVGNCIRRGDRVFDLTIGNETYKTKFGTVAEPVYEIWIPGNAMGSVAIAARGHLPRAKAMARSIPRLSIWRGA